jgi:hypothetical protein
MHLAGGFVERREAHRMEANRSKPMTFNRGSIVAGQSQITH